MQLEIDVDPLRVRPENLCPREKDRWDAWERTLRQGRNDPSPAEIDYLAKLCRDNRKEFELSTCMVSDEQIERVFEALKRIGRPAMVREIIQESGEPRAEYCLNELRVNQLVRRKIAIGSSILWSVK